MPPYQASQYAANYGTLSTLDTLAATNQTIAKFGEDRAWEMVEVALNAHNLIMGELLNNYVETTSDRLRRFGTPVTMRMVELDEFGTADAQKIIAGQNVGFPLRLYGIGVQWTRKYIQNATGAEFAANFTAAMDADSLRMITEIKRAIYTPTNYLFEDRLVDHLQMIQLPVKALVNADGAQLPVGPNGEIFDGTTHTHYLATASLANSDLVSAIETVIEHYASGRPVVTINRTEEAAVRALAEFVGYHDVRIVQPTTAQHADMVPLDVVNIYNRAIGVFHGAEVWVRPWAIPGYIFTTIQDQPKALVMRTRGPGSGDLVLATEDESHPLRARQFEREFGIGVWERTNGSILYINGGSYVAPTFG